MSSPRFTLIQFLAAYAVALVVMGALDGVWLGWLAKDFYREQLGPLMTDSVRIVPAAIYYLGFPAVIVYLALTPAASLGEAALRSAVLGLAAFGVYDLTNLAILRGYTLTMTVVDMAWGTFASAVGGAAAYRAVMALR
ncbi:DUF2177 family protein [Rhizobacter sp. Root404]|uniref:DUF2177 family protein n=1 Tax=Rhizobacter sp. Root404 TaxID=1736528 RepID=UPI0006FE0331|nr:DUF2177 family protein [Rhizobacter sp. Root404]KQW37813.1 hypothetical protein ASC76_06945 [Rhizobacter sp. Root404]